MKKESSEEYLKKEKGRKGKRKKKAILMRGKNKSGSWTQNSNRDSWLVGCRFKANCPLVGPGPAGGVPYVGEGGSFCRILARIYASFGEKARKTPNG